MDASSFANLQPARFTSFLFHDGTCLSASKTRIEVARSHRNNELFRYVGFYRPPHLLKPALEGEAECAEISAAEYIRMSTDHQQYSVEYQQVAIAAYAAQHKFRVVRSYIDPGRSGLRIERRDALRQLIDDVQSGQANFSTILVYDISRWGRFQDIDESAHYEFVCKKAGVPVQYCAEQFENNDTLISQLIKGLKRAMAGEYSRELSVKVFEGHKRAALKGLHQGGFATYGFRRLLVDDAGNPRALLKPAERKHFQTDHVVLTPGPASEIKTVQRVYRLFVRSRMPRAHIAELLNEEGRPNVAGNPWTNNNILRVLTNEKYIGNFIYGQTSKKLLGPTYRNPPELWIRVKGALQPIIDPELFASAQRILANPWWSFTDNQLLDHLTAALCKNGYLSSRILAKSKFTPAAFTYHERFGRLANAYRLIGYKPTYGYHHFKPDILPSMHRDLIGQMISVIEQHGGNVEYDGKLKILCVNGAVTIAVVIIPYSEPKSDLWGWTVRFFRFPKSELIFAARMNKANTKIIDYYLIPRDACPRTILRFTKNNSEQYKRYKLRSIPAFYKQCQKLYDRAIGGQAKK